MKYLHIVGSEKKFVLPFVDYISKNFIEEEHMFLILNSNSEDANSFTNYKNIKILKPYDSNNNFIRKLLLLIKVPFALIALLHYFSKSKKVFLHGLFDKKVIIFLFLFQNFLKKTNWLIWGGGDLDIPSQFVQDTLWNRMTKRVKGGFGGYTTYLEGDYKIAQELYDAKGVHHECFMYESNIYRDFKLTKKNNSTINIQLGNSADVANNHIEILEKLFKFKEANIKIYCILSYGEKPWAPGWKEKVIIKGKELFEEKFIPLTDFMAFDEYLEFLSEIDIAIFAHKRQQAMGNTITLLGLGKKVYMRNDITPWQLFKEIDVKVFDVANIEIDLIDDTVKTKNQLKIKEYFSKDNYLKQLQNLFESK